MQTYLFQNISIFCPTTEIIGDDETIDVLNIEMRFGDNLKCVFSELSTIFYVLSDKALSFLELKNYLIRLDKYISIKNAINAYIVIIVSICKLEPQTRAYLKEVKIEKIKEGNL